jgi:hypothetical protein
MSVLRIQCCGLLITNSGYCGLPAAFEVRYAQPIKSGPLINADEYFVEAFGA